jgi:hypothetical protein
LSKASLSDTDDVFERKVDFQEMIGKNKPVFGSPIGVSWFSALTKGFCCLSHLAVDMSSSMR